MLGIFERDLIQQAESQGAGDHNTNDEIRPMARRSPPRFGQADSSGDEDEDVTDNEPADAHGSSEDEATGMSSATARNNRHQLRSSEADGFEAFAQRILPGEADPLVFSDEPNAGEKLRVQQKYLVQRTADELRKHFDESVKVFVPLPYWLLAFALIHLICVHLVYSPDRNNINDGAVNRNESRQQALQLRGVNVDPAIIRDSDNIVRPFELTPEAADD